jgi:hypothetical protein
MTQKNFGVSVSGYYDPDGRSWETVAFQAGKPVLDKELNLSQDVDLGGALSVARRLCPSGWLTDDHINKSDPLTGVFVPSATANLLALSNDLRALVNGWTIEVQSTNAAAANEVSLGAAPTGNGAKRTDLVILEVWRRLISASPSTEGKSQTGRIWRNGNVKVPSGSDAGLNYADDLLDATVGSETTKRVQIQYRLRAVSGVDLFTYQRGIDDPVVVAFTVPASAGAPDGTLTAFAYANQSAAGDPGLWRAGDGDAANALGTVDGYMYAIPLVAVFRRNSTAWSRNLNHNGTGGPDALTHSIFVQNDVADLRHGASFTGWASYEELGEKNLGRLLDNVLRTEWTTTADGGGVNGHTVFRADEIGILPGDGTTTGDTPGATFIGQFDCTRRFFSDRPNYEVMTVQMTPGGAGVSTGTWQTGTVVTINPSTISQYPYAGSISFLSRAPSGTRIVDISRIWIQGASNAVEVGSGVSSLAAGGDVWPVVSMTGLSDYPPGNIVITLGTIPTALGTQPMYLDLLIAYPAGAGLTRTPTEEFGVNSFSETPGILPNTAPVSYNSSEAAAIDMVHREVQLQYRSENLSYTFVANSTANISTFYMPERVRALVSVTVNATPVSPTLDASGRILTFPGPVTSGATIVVNYNAVRPYPSFTGYQMSVYYKSRAPQTVHSSLVGTSATLIPRWISPYLYSITTGSGSQGEGYPYPFAYVQTGGVIKSSGSFTGEHELDGSVDMFVSEFNGQTGFIKVPAFIPFVPNPESVTFTRSLSDTDVEDRTFFPTVPGGNYYPNAFGQPLSNNRIHKTLLPTVMELNADTTLGKKGTLFLVVLHRWAEFDAENSVKFLTSGNATTASIFRIAGNLLNRRS